MAIRTATIFKDIAGEWRWHLRAENGNLVAVSGEGYKNKGDCRAECQKVLNLDDVMLIEQN